MTQHARAEQPLIRLLYIMIKPPLPIAEQMGRLPGYARSRPAHRLHLTILALGNAADWDGQPLRELERVLGLAQAPAVTVWFDRLRANGRQAWLAGSLQMRAAKALKRQLFDIVTRSGFDLAARGVADHGAKPLRPHITLDYRTALRFDEPIAPITWTADEFLLIESVHGGRHIERGRWPLVRPML